MNKIEIIINEKCWLEHTAKEQVIALGNLKGVERVVGLPDLHAGKIPIGVAIKTRDIIYPHLIGGDIGCGMQLINLTYGQLFCTNCNFNIYFSCIPVIYKTTLFILIYIE